MPKSAMRTWPRPSIMTFAGLRSRCSTPRSWAAPSPTHNCQAIWIALSPGSRPMRRNNDARSSPSTYSIEMNTSPSASLISYTRSTLGWVTLRASRTSFW